MQGCKCVRLNQPHALAVASLPCAGSGDISFLMIRWRDPSAVFTVSEVCTAHEISTVPKVPKMSTVHVYSG